MTTRCLCDAWAPSEECPLHGAPEFQAPRRCPDCGGYPEPGERHSLLDGVTEDGEPLGFTCLDAADRVIYTPTPTLTGPDPWSDPDAAARNDPPPF